MKTRRLMAMALLACLLLVPLAARADSHEGPKPLTWLSYVQSQTGKGFALSQNIAKNGAEIYDGLMASGDILSWGVAMPVNHRPGDDWNVVEWVTFPNWAGVDAFMGAFMARQMAKSPEDMKAEQEEWYSLIEAGSHYDEIVRHRVFKAAPDRKLTYLKLSYHSPRPGQYGALTEQLEKLAMPIMAKLFEDGAIGSYGLASPTIHGGTQGTHAVWYGMSDLSAQDAVTAARAAAAEERGEEAQKAAMAALGEATDWPAHHDRIFMVIHLGGQGGSEGGDEGDEGGE